MNLADVQARFYELVTAPENVAATVAARGPEARRALDEMIQGDDRLSAVERLDIYANMYFFRIHDVLRDEAPKTAAALGPDAFHNLVIDYLAACPPSHPSLREAGARLPAFLAAHPFGVERPCLAELARLERTRLELVDGPDATPLTFDDLRNLPPGEIGGLPLRLIPCAAVLANRFGVASLWRIDEDQALAAATRAAAPAAETLLVWRRDVDVYHRAVDADEARWLSRLQTAGSGDALRFETLCEDLAAAASDEEAAARAFELVGRWTADGVLAAG
jgi:hypothetical protein